MYALADVARRLGMGDYILLGRGEMLTGGKDKHSILADSVESMLGAIYLHHGFEVARATVLRLFADKITEAPTTGLTMDWKTVLLEKLSDMKLPLPTYEVRGEGPEHDKTFYATVTIEDLVTHGEGHTKKVAEHAAAKQAVQKLNERA